MDFDAIYQRIRDTLNQELARDGSNHGMAIRLLNSALPACGFSLQDVNTVASQSFIQHERALLDDGLQRYAMHLIMQAAAAGQSLMRFTLPHSAIDAPALPRFLSVVCWLAEAQLVGTKPSQQGAPAQQGLSTHELRPVEKHVLEPIHYFRMVEEILEAAAIDDAQQLFELLETSRMVEAKAAEFGQTLNAPMLCVLRSCIALLRRLSKTQDLEMCGRILIFVARLYSLNHNSGTNLHGMVNSALPLPPLDDVAPDTCDSSGEPVPVKLYQTFWGLQQVFKAPSSVLQPAYWAKTAADLEAVLDQLEARKVTVKAGPSFLAGNGESTGEQSANTTVHYLSSSKLFGLQLRDASFRRQFLVQCMILLHHVRKPGKNDKVPAGTKFDKLEELERRVYTAMAATDDCGEEFAAAVKHVLEHESQWVKWKHQDKACPNFEKPPAPPFRPAAAASVGGAGDGMSAPPAKRMRRAGARAAVAPSAALLRQLQEPADQMAGLKTSERKLGDRALLPSFDDFVEPVMMELDPESCVEPQYRRLNTDKVFCWKVMRSLSLEHLDMLSTFKGTEELPIEVGKALLDHYPSKKKQFEEWRIRKAEEEAKERAALLAAEAEQQQLQQDPLQADKDAVQQEQQGEEPTAATA